MAGKPNRVEYEATDADDLRLWQFGVVCKSLSSASELAHREENASKWRYSEHIGNGRWRYTERQHYRYNAIEDTRLDGFEKHLRLLKPVFPPERRETRVRWYLYLMSLWFRTPHWDFDREDLRFVEISDSKEHSDDGTEEPRPGSIIRVID